MNAHPAPWHVEAYRSTDGKAWFELVDRNGCRLIVTEDGKALEAIAKSRNEATAESDLAAMAAQMAKALQYRDEHEERMRASFDRQMAELRKANEILMTELEELRGEA